MDDLLEIVFEFVFELLGSSFDRKSDHESTIEIERLDETVNYESYIVGLIATAIAISYEDDHRLDKEEKKMIENLIKNNPYELTKKSKANLKYIRKHKIGIDNLSVLFVKLNIDHFMVTKITNDIENILRYQDKDITKKLTLLNKVKSIYEQ